MRGYFCEGAALLCLAAGPSTAQDMRSARNAPPVLQLPGPVPPISEYGPLSRIRAGVYQESFIADLMRPLRNADRDGNGLDEGDIGLEVARNAAARRAQAVMTVLNYDLDRDLVVTRQEVESREALENRSTAYVTATLYRYDGNKDGRITVEEAAASTANQELGRAVELRALLALDPNKDGRLTAAELKKLGEQTFARVDKDRDGFISEAEGSAGKIVGQSATGQSLACLMPPASADAKIILLSSYEADSLSSVAIGGQDNETNAMTVTVEPGKEPLYLVFSSYESMVWRLAGATSRVAHVVVGGHHGAAGEAQQRSLTASAVVGVAKKKVTILPVPCLRHFTRADDGGGQTASQIVANAAGRHPDRVLATYSANAVSVPDGQFTKAPPYRPGAAAETPKGFEPAMWREALRFWPGGVMAIEPRSVVAKLPVERYSVLPSQAGLAQLLGSGAVRRDGSGRTFIIQRAIPRIPASMGGSHRADFIVARGVPVPAGDLVHACMRVEETGEIRGVSMLCSRKAVDSAQ